MTSTTGLAEPAAPGGATSPTTASDLVRDAFRRFHWPLLLSMVLFLAAANTLWYVLDLHHHPIGWRLQPVFMIAGSFVYLALLRRFTGIRWRDISADGRFVMISSVVLFGLLWLFGRTGGYYRYLDGDLPHSRLEPLYGFFYFSINCFLARTVLPLLLIRYRLHKRPADFGYRLRGTFELWWVYLVLALAVMAVVWFYASTLPSFQARYPMARRILSHGTVPLWMFLTYQAAYGLIFISGESFWRGYIAFGLEKDLGLDALVFMIMPYTMAHYGKPLPETMGAMLTGLVLGYLALRHRSFWLGVAAHWSVAITMDVSALARTGIHIVW